jgi:glutathione synthase/RimK-type ligase-like ATP-grasp enzyme
MVASELSRHGTPFMWFDQRRALSTTMRLDVQNGTVRGVLGNDDVELPLETVRSVYVRTMDDRCLPEVEQLPPDSPERARCRALHDRLMTWLEITPAVVINRARAQSSNASKPYQSQLIVASAGFDVPETLITSEPDEVLAFKARHGRVIFKSMSGVRSVVKLLTDLDLQRIERIRWCPVQFQAYVEGIDVRVHTIDDCVFAARVMSDATDYRYSAHSGTLDPILEPFAIRDELAERCLRLSRALGLELAGIDLRITPSGEAVCFEVNPSPAFSYYERGAGLPIAAAIARRLASA